MKNTYIVIDAGTTNVRIKLIQNGQETDRFSRNAGVQNTAIDGNNDKLKASVREGIAQLMETHGLRAQDVTRCIAYGMITSNVGLVEIPHLVAPAGRDALCGAVREVDMPDIAPFPIMFIPGIKNSAEKVDLQNVGGMDMMRGEETEAVGLYRLLGLSEACVLVLPGSHNKFISMDENGAILGCMTSVSGEMIDAVSNHTILADAVKHRFVTAEDYDRTFMEAGYDQACAAGLGRALFAGRILSTLGGQPPEKIANYVLGVILQADVQALNAFANPSDRIIIAGKAPLATAIRDAIAHSGRLGVTVVPELQTRTMGAAGALAIAGEDEGPRFS